MLKVNILNPSVFHPARCVTIDKYSDTKAFKEATLAKENLIRRNQNRPLSEQIEIIKEVAVESLIGFIGIIHIKKNKTTSHSPKSLEISVRFTSLGKLSKGKCAYREIGLLNGIDMDSLEGALLPQDERCNYPWIAFYPSHRKIAPGEDWGKNITFREFYKPVILKDIKQE